MTKSKSFCWIKSGHRLKRYIGLETGLHYANLGNQIKKSDLNFTNTVDPYFGFVSPSTNSGPFLGQMKVLYSFHYLSLPLKVNFRRGGDQWQFICSLGFSTELLILNSQKTILYKTDGTNERNWEALDENLNRFNLSPSISVGVEYRLNRKMSLRAEPTFSYALMQISDSSISGYL